MLRVIVVFLSLLFARQAMASGTLYYGSRAGMEVTVVEVEGLNSSHAVIRTKHTRENAIAFCRDYVQNVTEACIRETLTIPLNDAVVGNCVSGEFVDFHGGHYRFLGPNRQAGQFQMAKFAIMNLATREIADGSSASGYPVNLALFGALCPARGPFN